MYSIEEIKRLEVKSSISSAERQLLYDIVKEYQPRYVVETGSGASTATILAALKANGLGRLISIDKPDFDGARKAPGEGDKIRELWTLLEKEHPSWIIHEANILQKLPDVVAALPQINFFFDDSCHTSEHVFAEWDIVSPKLDVGSIFGMHDIVGKFGKQMKAFVTAMNANSNWKMIKRIRAIGFWKRIR